MKITKMNKRADTFIQILLWILFGIILFILIILVLNATSENKKHNLITACEENCKKECQRFNYTFYKIVNCYLRWENCWCLDENNKPKSIGALS
jgi:hypothetical protein